MNALLTELVKTIRISNAAAAGVSDVVCTVVDMAGFDGARFIAGVGTLTANQVTALRIEQSSVVDGSGDAFADVPGADSGNLDDDDDNGLVIVDVFRPKERFLRATVDRLTANAVVDFVIVELYAARVEPVGQDATVVQQVLVVDPADA